MKLKSVLNRNTQRRKKQNNHFLDLRRVSNNAMFLSFSFEKPEVTVKFGIGIRINKPSRNCNGGWGVYELKAIFVETDGTANRLAKANVEFNNNSNLMTVTFDDVHNSEILALASQESNTMTIGDNDQNITVDQELLNELEITSLSLTPGTYSVYTNSDGKPEVQIPFSSN